MVKTDQQDSEVAENEAKLTFSDEPSYSEIADFLFDNYVLEDHVTGLGRIAVSIIDAGFFSNKNLALIASDYVTEGMVVATEPEHPVI